MLGGRLNLLGRWLRAERSRQARKRREGQVSRREKTRIPDSKKKKEG